VTARADLPPTLRDEFKYIAMPGEPWNGGDDGPPGSGFSFLWHYRHRWVGVMGQGGIAETFSLRVFEVSADGTTAHELAVSQAGNLCELAVHYLKL
jgi:hypothetical protein